MRLSGCRKRKGEIVPDLVAESRGKVQNRHLPLLILTCQNIVYLHITVHYEQTDGHGTVIMIQ